MRSVGRRIWVRVGLSDRQWKIAASTGGKENLVSPKEKGNYRGVVDRRLYAVTHKSIDEGRIRPSRGPARSSTCPDEIQALRSPSVAYGCTGTPFEFEATRSVRVSRPACVSLRSATPSIRPRAQARAVLRCRAWGHEGWSKHVAGSRIPWAAFWMALFRLVSVRTIKGYSQFQGRLCPHTGRSGAYCRLSLNDGSWPNPVHHAQKRYRLRLTGRFRRSIPKAQTSQQLLRASAQSPSQSIATRFPACPPAAFSGYPNPAPGRRTCRPFPPSRR